MVPQIWVRKLYMSSDVTGREIIDSTEVTDDAKLWNEVRLLRTEDADDEPLTLDASEALLVPSVCSPLDSPLYRGEAPAGPIKEACLPSSAYRVVSPEVSTWNRLAELESRRRCSSSRLGCGIGS